VRDLRRSAAAAIIAARRQARFASLRELLGRVSLQVKEVENLIRCGALDGLGASRAAMLIEAGVVQRAGSARQMSFLFGEEPEAARDSPAERLAWESQILGYPVSVQPLRLVVAEAVADCTPLRRLAATHGRPVIVAGFRLPGWTGGPGYYVGDGDSLVIARPVPGQELERALFAAWRPLRLQGRWRQDEWGGGWLQVDSAAALQ
jgi:hypothetical protein